MQYQGRLLRVDLQAEVIAQASFGPSGPTGLVTIATLSNESILAGGTASWKGWLLRTDKALRAIVDRPLEGTEDIRSIAALPDGGFVTVANTNQSTTALGLSVVITHNQDDSPRWQTRLPTHGRGELTCITVLANGNLAAAGHHTADEQGPAQIWVVLIDPSGTLVWENFFGERDIENRGRAITVASDNSLLIASDAMRSLRRHASLLRLSQDGNLLSQQTFGDNRMRHQSHGIAATADNGCVLVGSVIRDSEKSRGWIVRLDNAGQTQWELQTTPPSA
jgi:hypothetical protein